MYTMNIPTLSLETKVVGVTFERRQAVVAQLKVGEEVCSCSRSFESI